MAAPFEPPTFRYAVHELPPGRVPFRRYRWELWNRSRLEASGWRVSEQDATRALRQHGSRVCHRMLGIPPRAASARDFDPVAPGTAVNVRDGAVMFTLVPLQLDTETVEVA